jgi:hypothetical protein
VTPFQCDLCTFWNLAHHNPSDSAQDNFLLCCICRTNLDAIWGRETQTVQATLQGTRQMLSLWRVVHIPITLPVRGPFPVSDLFGVRVAISMLIKSLDPGRYSKDY